MLWLCRLADRGFVDAFDRFGHGLFEVFVGLADVETFGEGAREGGDHAVLGEEPLASSWSSRRRERRRAEPRMLDQLFVELTSVGIVSFGITCWPSSRPSSSRRIASFIMASASACPDVDVDFGFDDRHQVMDRTCLATSNCCLTTASMPSRFAALITGVLGAEDVASLARCKARRASIVFI